jgi:energy-coupling factor transporter ATP-binding protein EcfA2
MLCSNHVVTIASLTRELLKTRRLLVCGPSDSGKTQLVRALAYHVTAAHHAAAFTAVYSAADTAPVSSAVSPTFFTVSGTNGLQLCQLLTSTVRQKTYGDRSSAIKTDAACAVSGRPSTDPSAPPLQVLVIEDVDQGGGVTQTIERCLSGGSWGPHSNLVLLVTSGLPAAAHAGLTNLCDFRWVGPT